MTVDWGQETIFNSMILNKITKRKKKKKKRWCIVLALYRVIELLLRPRNNKLKEYEMKNKEIG